MAAVNIAGAGETGYTQNADIAPPWLGYSKHPDIYGSYIWLYSLDGKSRGFFVFYCHLKSHDPFLMAMAGKVGTIDDIIDENTRVGTVGDTGNATNDPQLHMEIHLPQGSQVLPLGSTFTCTRCTDVKSGMTAINPFPSLNNAAIRRV